MKMVSKQFDEVSEKRGLMTLVRKKHLLVSKGRQEVSGIYGALTGQTNTPRKRHTWLNLARRNNRKPLSIVLSAAPTSLRTRGRALSHETRLGRGLAISSLFIH